MNKKHYLIAIIAALVASSSMIGITTARYISMQQIIKHFLTDYKQADKSKQRLRIVRSYANYLATQGTGGLTSSAFMLGTGNSVGCESLSGEELRKCLGQGEEYQDTADIVSHNGDCPPGSVCKQENLDTGNSQTDAKCNQASDQEVDNGTEIDNNNSSDQEVDNGTEIDNNNSSDQAVSNGDESVTDSDCNAGPNDENAPKDDLWEICLKNSGYYEIEVQARLFQDAMSQSVPKESDADYSSFAGQLRRNNEITNALTADPQKQYQRYYDQMDAIGLSCKIFK